MENLTLYAGIYFIACLYQTWGFSVYLSVYVDWMEARLLSGNHGKKHILNASDY